jgi:Transcription factor WhiB
MVVTTPELVHFLMDPNAVDGPMGLDEVVHRPAWMTDAACRDEPTSTFFIERGGNMARARALCAGCQVAGECLEYAMADEDLDGFWAGTSGRERRRLRARAS